MFRLVLLFSLSAVAWGQGWFIRLPQSPSKHAAALQAHASVSQAALSQWLDSRKVTHKRFWIVNAVYLPKADQKLLDELRRAGYEVLQEQRIKVEPIVAPEGSEWGVELIEAPKLWAEGLTGQGVIVGVLDTGADVNHPALAKQYAGEWYDPANICQGTPCDNVGHGTHVTGTILGAGGIGVAPEAKFIACKGCESNWCSESSLLACAQWMLEKKPNIINNSWGGPGSGNLWFQEAAKAWRAAGILPVFAAGNNGPSCGTVGNPGGYPEVLSVAAIGSNKVVASFSSRGPGTNGVQKPDVAAPGVNVRSALPGGGYGNMSGTSMATPHVSGLAALLWNEAKGDLETLEKALRGGVYPVEDQSCGETQKVPNYSYGWGIVNAVLALDKLRVLPPPPPPPNKPPAVKILEPADGAIVYCGQIVKLRAEAFDFEDGDLSNQIVWWAQYPFWKGSTAEHIGATGLGCELGWHIYRAEVVDSAGDVGAAQVRVLVAKP